MAAATLSICFGLTRHHPFPLTASVQSGTSRLFASDSIPYPALTCRPKPAIRVFRKSATAGVAALELNAGDAEEAAVSEIGNTDRDFIPEADDPVPAESSGSSVEPAASKREEVFAVVMVGSRQYIVFPGRYIYTQRLKGANVNDKISLNKVLLVGTKTSTYIGKPIVPNATVLATVEEQTLDKKVIVFKYKKKKHYRRNIGHRQPITRIRITSITGYQGSPAVTLS